MESTLESRHLRIVEFFSGIGGWHEAVNQLFSDCPSLTFEIVAAYDINDASNSTYELFHGVKPIAKTIESIPFHLLDSLKANVWFLSPPCQPHTRQHSTKDDDPRDKGLLHIIETLKSMENKPAYIALENVKGFEKSSSCQIFLDTLELLSYEFIQFSLNPFQFGIPNQRPRYYLIATKKTDLLKYMIQKLSSYSTANLEFGLNYQSNKRDQLYNYIPHIPQRLNESIFSTHHRQIKEYLDHYNDINNSFDYSDLIISETILEKKSSWCMDIVTENDISTSCFTKSYSKFFKGTGSVLVFDDSYDVQDTELHLSYDAKNDAKFSSYTNNEEKKITANNSNILDETIVGKVVVADIFLENQNNVDSSNHSTIPEVRMFDGDWSQKLNGRKLRFFSPTELLRLFGFIDIKNSNNLTATMTEINEMEMNLSNDDKPVVSGSSGKVGNGKEKEDDGVINNTNSKKNVVTKLFPSSLSRKKCYELIGNSVNVLVVKELLRFLFHSLIAVEEYVVGDDDIIDLTHNHYADD